MRSEDDVRIGGLVLLVLAVMTGCRSGEARTARRDQPKSPQDPIAGIPVQERWRFEAGNPIIRLGDFRSLATWNDPCVLRSVDGYVMYLTTALKQPGSPPVAPFRAVSTDGLNWRLEPETTLLDSGAAGAFDSASVETPSVVRFRGKYHLYYTGVGSGGLSGSMAIGHAVSDDGIRWTKDARPVLTPTGKRTDWNGYQVAEPGAVVYQDRILLYFAAVGLRAGGDPPVRRVIGLATSKDGTEFGPAQEVLAQHSLYPPEKGFDGYSTPSAAVDGGKVHLFYDVGYFDARAAHKWTQVALHHAVSSDGRTGWVQDGEAITTRARADWTGLEVRAPSPLFEGGRLRLWFAGNANPDRFVADVRATRRTGLFGIGYGELPAAPK